MKLERIALNQIKYSISFEELSFKGITEEELLKEPYVWDALFDKMLDEAHRVYDLQDCEAMAVEIYSLNANELVLILTLEDEDIIDSPIGLPEPIVPTDEDHVIFTFATIDDCIYLAKRLSGIELMQSISTLYALKNSYYLVIMKGNFKPGRLFALGEEYGERCTQTWAYLQDYGKSLIEKTALETLNSNF